MPNTKTADLEAKFQKAIEAATDKDGVTTLKVTLLGDGVMSNGEGTLGRYVEDDVMTTTPDRALNLVKRGWVSPVKPAAKSK